MAFLRGHQKYDFIEFTVCKPLNYRVRPGPTANCYAAGKIERDAAERGAVRKRWTGRLPIALLFPNTYPVGMANLGFQILYRLLNRRDEVVTERFFLPAAGQPLRSVESQHPLADFPLVFVSCSFEADYATVPAMLAMADLPVRAADRGRPRPGDPLVVAGGVATFLNPEPLSPYIDCFLVGEAEPVIDRLLDILLDLDDDRETLLRRLAVEVPGCYVPSLYEVHYHPDGTVAWFEARHGAPLPVRRNRVVDLSVSGHTAIVSGTAQFRDTFLVELGRGCSRACRFCAAGFVYRPPRHWRARAILDALAERPADTDRVGLLGLEMVDEETLTVVAEALLVDGCSLSFSSLRADAVGGRLLEVLARSDVKTAVLAPDGPSERLRRVINKQIDRDQVLTAAARLAEAGISTLKLYFMLGLPTETDEDLEEMLDLLHAVAESVAPAVRNRRRALRLQASVSCFVPKPWTPFQFHPMAGLDDLKRRIGWLRKHAGRVAGLRLQVEKPEHALYQAVLARGDRRLGAHLAASAATTPGRWLRLLVRRGVDPLWYAGRQRGPDEVLPWEILDNGIDKRYLWQEYQRGLAEKTTPACQVDRCRRCGACG